MERFFKTLFSNKLTGLLLILYAVAMAVATFIENDYGTETARTLVYNAKWFEIVHLIMIFNFIGNIQKYKLFSLAKLPILIFHLALIIIILGAGITRYRGSESMMSIKEGQSSNILISYDSYLMTAVGNEHFYKNFSPHKLALSEWGNNDFSKEYEFEDTEVKLHVKEYIPRAKYNIKETDNGNMYLQAVFSVNGKRRDFYIEQGSWERINGLSIAFDNTSKPADIQITYHQEENNFKTTFSEMTSFFTMATSEKGILSKDTLTDLKFRSLYTIKKQNVVFVNYFENAILDVEEKEKENNAEGVEGALVVDVEVNSKTKELILMGGRGFLNPPREFFFNDRFIKLNYGSKQTKLPFNIYLKDFKLERYIGSDSPSSYSSDIEVRDGEHTQAHNIFMNNVLDYKGYRFFQSAYHPDELGTILSVNQDYWGTWVTYIGYFLMGLGMILTLVWKGSYFRMLLKEAIGI